VLSFTSYPLETIYPIDDISLSLVVPSFNEESRVSSTIDHAIKFLNTLQIKYEIIIVNDGSKDNTWSVILELMKKYPEILSGINYRRNGGKGYAVKTGVKYSRGQNILMIDADGATNIKDYLKLMSSFEGHKEIMAIGSRSSVQETKASK